ncbi:Catalyzes the transfer of endogenously produced octanoic acid from octanoyl-acyl-carrier-protein onto the lipoyl domains of lipoate-dependent enzymes. Lipoyl-ACP can also act as a substrate although octanoyl-ACP is likely to be the physiological subs [Seminavis robusta]|uniref:Cyclin N-terminal domain-containing protein n=1 Tax=Seminavis robusta TaxID=568900 RepID=A0A9N8EGE5_9STRA|nr:Catalyzes the transfer of endogenously produced octanoic acid from octanoyl-acyl-carrier-protein onto the lipoyl domains of lipoate-dependent enzymes. Lipoyl-ACP can also act as a substrate although octanoyl-ACP is likely to be the physiological subs [Seminavis robusta]|eukprot:Sro1087_g239830.1 Catalyzes the transfer of endogenously produced octanoic acid from octanoyl-acyl-carrier-protein onto the lipoyl domains of lipoate-dependent enzymes. Lipoyl-ACP can also act as a substrate although octanoyl-ACP is likely to be the physiological subs (325) ;mRNA; r:16862-17836
MVNTMIRQSSSSSRCCEGPSTVEVLRKQEMSACYQCRDYLEAADSKAESVTEATRAEMLEWVCKVSSFLKLNDDIAITTATLLDRFSQTPQGNTILSSVPSYRLATMACFYLTTKVHAHEAHDDLCPCTVSAETMSAFSHGLFSAQQVEEMELCILQSMGWRTNPPTALTFVREFLLLLPCSVSSKMKDHAYQLCQAQIQGCMLDYDLFALTEASTIAFFAVQNALRTLGMDEILLKHIAAIFSYATHTDYTSRCSEQIQAALVVVRDKPSPTSPPFLKKRRQQRRRSSASSTSTSSSSSSRRRHRWSARRMDSLDVSPRAVAV